MKKRGVTRKAKVNTYKSNRRAGVSVRPALVLGGIIAVIILISLANWLYRTGAFAATPTSGKVVADAAALITQTNNDIQAVAAQYEVEMAKMDKDYQAQIDELNNRIDRAIINNSVAELTGIGRNEEVGLLSSSRNDEVGEELCSTSTRNDEVGQELCKTNQSAKTGQETTGIGRNEEVGLLGRMWRGITGFFAKIFK
jgi:hypothetical protein